MISCARFNKGGRKILAAIREECGRAGAFVGELGGGGKKVYAMIEFRGERRKVYFSAMPPGAILNRSRAARHRVKEAVLEISRVIEVEAAREISEDSR